MATQVAATHLADSDRKQTGAPGSVARQPIMDLHSIVHGYELMFWNGSEPVARSGNGLATSTMLDNAVILGLEQLACGLQAFVNCSAESVIEEWVQVLPPKMTVVQLASAAEATPGLIAACLKLKEMGFRLAVKDFTGKPKSSPLTDLADYIKVDVVKVDAARRANLFRLLESTPARFVAQNVETQEQYGQACKEGFELFQGYYFCHPEPLKSHRIPGNRLVHLEILEDLQNDPVDMHRLSQLVMCDASLVYRLLRLVNSPVCAVRQEVTSIQTALMLVGEAMFRRIAMLAIASDFNTDQPAELLHMAFERGRFCELAAGLCGQTASEQYLIGIVSLFPAMLRILMEDLIRLLPLRAEARDALLGNGNREGILLRWRECQEYGNWAACDEIVRCNGLDHRQVMRCHAEAVAWADAALKFNA